MCNKGGASSESDKDGIANYCKAGIMVRCHGPRNVAIEKTTTQQHGWGGDDADGTIVEMIRRVQRVVMR